ncbi:MAG: helix-turn-helix transcriptional regulator [Actinobacteria bacterium]|nr:helix-turn-helix transcriptional regulator [Actinomycetota bacterium]
MVGRETLRCVADPEIIELAEELKILSDPNRLRIMCLLLRGERCVCEVEKELGISQQLASHHLNVLREDGLLRVRKEGTSSYYAVAEDKLDRVVEAFLRYLGHRGRREGENGDACCTPAPAALSRGAKSVSGKGGARR